MYGYVYGECTRLIETLDSAWSGCENSVETGWTAVVEVTVVDACTRGKMVAVPILYGAVDSWVA